VRATISTALDMVRDGIEVLDIGLDWLARNGQRAAA